MWARVTARGAFPLRFTRAVLVVFLVTLSFDGASAEWVRRNDYFVGRGTSGNEIKFIVPVFPIFENSICKPGMPVTTFVSREGIIIASYNSERNLAAIGQFTQIILSLNLHIKA